MASPAAEGLYRCVFPKGVTGTLAMAKDGSGALGTIMNNGIVGQARWIPVEQSIAPACLKATLVAVAVLAVVKQIQDIKDGQKEIVSILERDKKSQLLADYDLVIRLLLMGYRGVLFEGNVVTCKLGEQATKHVTQVEAECNHIFYKNYKPLYPLTNEQLDRMVKFSEIPRPLLDKLASVFPEEDYDLFMERYEQMYEMRLEAARNQREQERRGR